MTELADEKSELRRRMKRVRAERHQLDPDAAMAVVTRICGLISSRRYDGLGGYFPTQSELDPRPSMLASGLPLFLPVVRARDAELEYRSWSPGDALIEGLAGTMEPDLTSPRGQPDCILLPGLAFDASGYRLGYGGGYFDRTLHSRRSAGKLLAIGLCYDAQIVHGVPHDERDQPVDLIVTPERVIRVPAG